MQTVQCMKTDNSIRINIPRLIRDALGLTRGTTLAFEVVDDTTVKLINIERQLDKLKRAAA